MDDCDRLLKLIRAGYGCISIVTHEEQHALEIVRLAALNMSRPLWLWSVAGGVRDGLLTDSPSIAETELPAAGLRSLMDTDPGSICVTLDLAEHLKGLALRMLRDMIADICSGFTGRILSRSASRKRGWIRSYAIFRV